MPEEPTEEPPGEFPEKPSKEASGQGVSKKQSKGSIKKRSPAKEACKWVFDLAILFGLIWYFSNPINTRNFWNGLETCFEKGVAIAFSLWRQGENAAPVQNAATVPSPLQNDRNLPPPMFIPPPLPTREQLDSEVAGDCFPPEVRSKEDAEAVAKLFYRPPPLPKQKRERKKTGQPVQFARKKIKNVPFYQVTIDLTDPDSYIVIRLPHNAERANCTSFTAGHESFDSFVKRCDAAIAVNGTFFSKDEQERVMGNMVSEGKMLKYSEWENYGTTLGLKEQNYPEMVTARAEGKPDWSSHWFSLTCGPRLVKKGEIWLDPELEGFADPHVLGCGPRSAIGFPQSRDKLYIVVFQRGLSLKEEARLMQAIGCYEAMNIDGGASKALAHDNSVVIKPGRALTNVVAVYDSKHKAPPELIASWNKFQKNVQAPERITSR